MDYGKLITSAFQITLRHRFRWLLGIFAGGAGGAGGGYGGHGDRPSPLHAPDHVAVWVMAHLPLVIILGAIFLLVIIFFIVVSMIAKGGLIASVARIEEQQPVSFVPAVNVGYRAFWRVLAVNLLLGLAILSTIACVALPIVVLALTEQYVAAVLLGVFLLLPLVAALIYLVLLLMYAERVAVVAPAGAIASIARAHRIIVGSKLQVLLVGTIAIGLAFGASFATSIVLLIIALPHIAAGIAVYLALGLIPTLIYAAVPALMVIAAAVLLSGITTTFQSSYWTLAYLQLTRPPSPPVPAPLPATP